MSTLNDFLNHPIESLERALHLRRQIDQLNEALKELFGPKPAVHAREAQELASTTKRRGRPPKATAGEPIDELSPGAELVKGKRKRRKMSAEAKARISEAQKLRWAKSKGLESATLAGPVESTSVSKPRKKRKISAAYRAKLKAAAKARWARVKKSKGRTQIAEAGQPKFKIF